ncbi:uncharacterized protein LOC119726086 [Patiria miniata]|uniref:Uncharacterized protein n=1 Tax=Patiria miniata TaxID=46514 RepID=A0A913ZR56_PATMI|nr:uncharacterized protein LOC119726086 [Patiria miniata]
MAYRQGITCGASVTLLIGSAVLIGLYMACSELSCPAIAYSYLSPLWTGGLLMVTAFLGIFMSATKSEKGCGSLYLFLSMLGVLATMGCVCLTLYAFLLEIGLLAMLLTATTTAAPTTVAAPTTLATTPTDPVVFYSLWGCMACVAFGLFIMTCVTSCQYSCCCQEPVVNERVVVVTQNQPASPQNITLETTNTIVNQSPTPQPIVLNTLQPGSGQYYLQQPHPAAQQALFGPPVGQQPVFLQAQPVPRRPSEPEPQASGSGPADNQSVRQERWSDIQHTYEGNPLQALPGPRWVSIRLSIKPRRYRDVQASRSRRPVEADPLTIGLWTYSTLMK